MSLANHYHITGNVWSGWRQETQGLWQHRVEYRLRGMLHRHPAPQVFYFLNSSDAAACSGTLLKGTGGSFAKALQAAMSAGWGS